MESKVRIIRPHQVQNVSSFGMRRGTGQDRGSRKAFALDSPPTTPPPDDDELENVQSADRSVTPPEPDEAGAHLDITA